VRRPSLKPRDWQDTLEKKGASVIAKTVSKDWSCLRLLYLIYDAVLMDIRMPGDEWLCCSVAIRQLDREDAAVFLLLL